MLRKVYGHNPRWYDGDREITEEEWELLSAERKRGDGFCTNFHMDADYSTENRGRGRKSMQMMKHPKDDGDHCYFRSTEELKEKVKQQPGWSYETA